MTAFLVGYWLGIATLALALWVGDRFRRNAAFEREWTEYPEPVRYPPPLPSYDI